MGVDCGFGDCRLLLLLLLGVGEDGVIVRGSGDVVVVVVVAVWGLWVSGGCWWMRLCVVRGGGVGRHVGDGSLT